MNTVGLRERKKQRTRADMIAVALRLFTERGFDNVTVDEIGAAAEVSHRTFYRYFACKEDLVLGDMSEGLDTLHAAFVARPMSESVVDSIRNVILELAEGYEHDAETDRRRAELIMGSSSLQYRRHQHLVAFEAALIPLIAVRLATDPSLDMRPALIAACAGAAVRVAVNSWMAGGCDGSLRPAVEQAFTLLTSGLT